MCRRLAPLLLAFAVLLPGREAAAQLSADSIRAAHRYSATHDGRGMIVKEGGRIRFEQYYNGYGGEPLHIYSGTKSFFGVLAVIAQEEGLLDLDERVAETLPEWRDDPRKRRITIRELLNFTSGLEDGFEEIYGRSPADKLTLAVSLDATRDRGESFVYGPSHLQVFCEVLRRKLADRGVTYEEYLRRKLIRPLGIEITRWRDDAHGNVIPSAGMYMTGRDWLKFGEMINRGGRWKGRRLVETDSLVECFSGTEINPAFGLCFWVNAHAAQPDARVFDVEERLEEEPLPEDWRRACLCREAPVDLVVSLGSTFQRLYLVPSMELVVVHHGKPGHEFRDDEFLRLLFRDAAGMTSTGSDAPRQPRETRRILPKLLEGLRGE